MVGQSRNITGKSFSCRRKVLQRRGYCYLSDEDEMVGMDYHDRLDPDRNKYHFVDNKRYAVQQAWLRAQNRSLGYLKMELVQVAKKQVNNNQDEPLEKQLWKAADKLRKNIDAAEYKHVVLGLMFLRYISEAFEELYMKLKSGEGEYEGADPEDRDEYKAENVFFVPAEARWSHLQSMAKKPEIGTIVDNAMDVIEKENPSLKGVLPKVYAQGNLDPTSLGGLIDLFSNISLAEAKSRSGDVLGHVFEYFLGEFALAEGKKGGQFYTPRNVVELLVEMLEPYNGRVFDIITTKTIQFNYPILSAS